MIPEPSAEPDMLAAHTASINGGHQPQNGQPVVELRGLTRTYGSDPPVLALRGIDLTIHAGDWLAIVGPSGSGKSTVASTARPAGPT
jgi:putative ABC transport system ATP-binding protein